MREKHERFLEENKEAVEQYRRERDD
jgi:hypothetical protein